MNTLKTEIFVFVFRFSIEENHRNWRIKKPIATKNQVREKSKFALRHTHKQTQIHTHTQIARARESNRKHRIFSIVGRAFHFAELIDEALRDTLFGLVVVGRLIRSHDIARQHDRFVLRRPGRVAIRVTGNVDFWFALLLGFLLTEGYQHKLILLPPFIPQIAPVNRSIRFFVVFGAGNSSDESMPAVCYKDRPVNPPPKSPNIKLSPNVYCKWPTHTHMHDLPMPLSLHDNSTATELIHRQESHYL